MRLLSLLLSNTLQICSWFNICYDLIMLPSGSAVWEWRRWQWECIGSFLTLFASCSCFPHSFLLTYFFCSILSVAHGVSLLHHRFFIGHSQFWECPCSGQILPWLSHLRSTFSLLHGVLPSESVPPALVSTTFCFPQASSDVLSHSSCVSLLQQPWTFP